jgi:hypothetical protein
MHTLMPKQLCMQMPVSIAIMSVPEQKAPTCLKVPADHDACCCALQVRQLEVDTLGPAGVGRLSKATSNRQLDNMSGEKDVLLLATFNVLHTLG